LQQGFQGLGAAFHVVQALVQAGVLSKGAP